MPTVNTDIYTILNSAVAEAMGTAVTPAINAGNFVDFGRTTMATADADVIFSDNYFHLTGEPREVEVKKADIYRGSFADAEDLKKRLQVRSLRDTY